MYFLICSERSGSNFITKLMNGHPRICGPAPKHLINPVARNLFRYKNINNPENWEFLLKDITNLLNSKFSVWKKDFTYEDLKGISDVGDISTLIKNIFYSEARANGKQHVFIKENHIYEFVLFLENYYPEAKYIYLVRDPRDMALSWKKNPIHPGGVVNAAKQWKFDQQKNLFIHNILKYKNKSYLITYEELIKDTENVLIHLMDFMGLPYDRKMLTFYEDELTKMNSQKQVAWENLSKPVISNNRGKYLKELTLNEIKIIEKICYYEMLNIGYSPGHKLEELESVTDFKIEELQKSEIEKIELKRGDLVLENMEAKKVFYQKG